MTLILTVATPYWVVQVADRLLTINHSGSSDVHDHFANKTIVYRAKDAIVTMGYSGIAYIGDIPTDEWIAQCLWGGSLPRGPDGKRPAKCFRSPVTNNWNLGYAIECLKKKLQSLGSTPVDQYGLYITIAGWQTERRGARPTIVEITRYAGVTKVLRAPRIWSDSSNFLVDSIGATVDVQELKAAFEPFRGESGLLRCTPLQAETAIADNIRSKSSSDHTVGAHLLSVILPRPDLAHSTCRFLPMIPHTAVISTVNGPITIPVSHTPWIVGGGALYPPSVEVGNTTISLGGLQFVVQGASQPSGIVGLSSSIRRPTPPARR